MDISYLLSATSVWNILIRFLINSLVLYVLIVHIYYRYSRKEEYLFFYSLTGIMIFLICSILGSIELQVGLALGLFAIFAIIRFRTVAFSVKDMTYMFVIIGISIINSQANIPPPVAGAVIVNLTIIALTWSLEKYLKKKSLAKQSITINNLELLRPEHQKELLKELSLLTGQNVVRFNIEHVDFDRKRADVVIFYSGERLRYEKTDEISDVESVEDKVIKDLEGKERLLSQ